MMVLVTVAIGTGWVYSVAATFWIAGDVFYEAAAFLAVFVPLGHWFEMRARGGANDAIRALLDLAPPRAVVIRDGRELELPTAEVQVGDLLLIRPGGRCRSTPRCSKARARWTSRWSQARCRQFLGYGAAQESKLPSVGLPRLTGFEGLLRKGPFGD
jgi:hypothetical protein